MRDDGPQGDPLRRIFAKDAEKMRKRCVISSAEFYFIEPTEIKVNRCEGFGRVREISKSRKLYKTFIVKRIKLIIKVLKEERLGRPCFSQ